MNGYDSHTEEKYEWGRVFFQTLAAPPFTQF
jgi:hypothetical protein